MLQSTAAEGRWPQSPRSSWLACGRQMVGIRLYHPYQAPCVISAQPNPPQRGRVVLRRRQAEEEGPKDGMHAHGLGEEAREEDAHEGQDLCGHHVLVETWIMLGGLPGSSRIKLHIDLPAPISAPPPSRDARLGPGTPKCRDGRAAGALYRTPPPVRKMIPTDQ